ncbi:MAG: hypothetical protein QXV83_02795 [Candidatus Anstonellaceae archaeon]
MKEKVLVDLESLPNIKKNCQQIFFDKIFLMPKNISTQFYYKNFFFYIRQYLLNDFDNVCFFDYFYKNPTKHSIKYFLNKRLDLPLSQQSVILLFEEIEKLRFILNTKSKNSLFLFVEFLKKQKINGKNFILIEKNGEVFLSSSKKVGMERFYFDQDLAVELYSYYLNCEQKNHSDIKFLLNNLKLLIPTSYLELDKLLNNVQYTEPTIFNFYLIIDNPTLVCEKQKSFKYPNNNNHISNTKNKTLQDIEKKQRELMFSYYLSIKEILNNLKGEVV